MEKGSSKMSVPLYQTMQHHIPDNRKLHIHHHKNLTSHII